jgi:hypothetical protein
MSAEELINKKHGAKGFEPTFLTLNVEQIIKLMEEYAEQQYDKVYELFAKPRKELEPLEELWRKENSSNEFVIPDETEFFRWIVRKELNNGIS